MFNAILAQDTSTWALTAKWNFFTCFLLETTVSYNLSFLSL